MSRKLSIIGLFLCLPLLMAATLSVQAQDISDLSSDELKKLIDQQAEVLVIDTRTVQEFNNGHIRGAVNISSQASNQFRTLAALLPEDKQIPLVFYCRSLS